jgi:hypothetical protein
MGVCKKSQELHIKNFSFSHIEKRIGIFEESIGLCEPRTHAYVEIDKHRYIKVSTFVRLITAFWKETKYRRLKTFTVQKIIILLIKSVFFRKKICCTSDILHIRNNLSLFYFDIGCRAKIYLGGQRQREDFENEFFVLQSIYDSECPIRIPKPISRGVSENTPFFIDEIIDGASVNWNDLEAPPLLKKMIVEIWSFYEHNGIEWRIFEDVFSTEKNLPEQIKRNIKKRIPVACLHGDFSIGNVLVDSGEVYYIDWELSHRGPVIKDFFKLFRRDFSLFSTANSLMVDHLEKIPNQHSNTVLSFEEQFEIWEFLHTQDDAE